MTHYTRTKCGCSISLVIGINTKLSGSRDLVNLNQVAAGIIEHGRGGHAHVGGFHRELHTQTFQPIVFFLNTADLESRIGDPIPHESFIKRLHGWVSGVWLENQLRSIGIFR